jgi:CubicO group peptidase (beta-lactamase class C family)
LRLRKPGSALVLLILLATAASARQTPDPGDDLGPTAFQSYLELLRQEAGIPGLSGLLIQDDEVVWERGLGFADVEARIRATPTTPYLVADLTQTFSAVLLLQCVEQRILRLDGPLRAYGVSVSGSDATLRQVMSHLSRDSGDSFQYDPSQYAQLAAAVEHCAPQPFRKSVAHRLLERLAMTDSVPGVDFRNSNVVPPGLFDPSALSRYARVLEDIAVPYRVDRRGRATRADVPVDGINAATGLVSTVRDLAKFNRALDSGILLREDTQDTAWSRTRLADGSSSPAGLGWFVQSYRDTKVVWQFGLVPNRYSALFVKVPSRNATMILLANSDRLAVPYQLQDGDVTRSPFAALFLRMLL